MDFSLSSACVATVHMLFHVSFLTCFIVALFAFEDYIPLVNFPIMYLGIPSQCAILSTHLTHPFAALQQREGIIVLLVSQYFQDAKATDWH